LKFDKSILQKILQEIHVEREFTTSLDMKKRFVKAVELVKEGKVKKYVFQPSGRIVWIVVGRKREYEIIPLANFCSCDDFYFNVINNKTPLCYHLIAQKIAEKQKRFDKIDTSDAWYEILKNEWKKIEIEKIKLPHIEMKNVRESVKSILSLNKNLTIRELLSQVQTQGFDVLTTRQLAQILSKDKENRFFCSEGKWNLRK